MTLFAEFLVPAKAFALQETLETVPQTTIEIERVVAHDEILTPYFWVSGGSIEAFERAAQDDPSVRDLRKLDEFENSVLYRAEWTDRTEAVVYAYTTIGAAILEARGHKEQWNLRIRFNDRPRLSEFDAYCEEEGIDYTLQQLYETEQARAGLRYGLTPKQHEALEVAWELGYFDTPRRATLDDVAEQIGISRQSLSQRIRRAHRTWIETALLMAPSGNDFE